MKRMWTIFMYLKISPAFKLLKIFAGSLNLQNVLVKVVCNNMQSQYLHSLSSCKILPAEYQAFR